VHKVKKSYGGGNDKNIGPGTLIRQPAAPLHFFNHLFYNKQGNTTFAKLFFDL